MIDQKDAHRTDNVEKWVLWYVRHMCISCMIAEFHFDALVDE